MNSPLHIFKLDFKLLHEYNPELLLNVQSLKIAFI